MSGVSFRYSEAGVRKVRRVQFGILGPVELKASSMCNIVTDRTFEKGKPIPGGLMDPALGAIDLLLNCASCGMDSFECPGHFGHLELTKPMYHVSFLITTLKVLRCVCFSCSAILGDQPAEDGKAKLVLVEANAKVDAAEADRIADRAAQQKQLAKANAQLESIARKLAERDEQLASTQSSLEDARAALATESERAKKLD